MARPRSAECDRAILDAALAEYAAGGFDGMSVDAVAARAGVSKATIYRRYPCKTELVVAAAFCIAEETAPQPDTGTLRGDITATLLNLRKLLTDPLLGAAMRMLMVDSQQSDELEQMHAAFVAKRRATTREQLKRAIARGELRDDVDLDLAMDTLVAPLFYRHLVANKPVSEAYVRGVVEDFLARYGAYESAN